MDCYEAMQVRHRAWNEGRIAPNFEPIRDKPQPRHADPWSAYVAEGYVRARGRRVREDDNDSQ